MVVHDIRNIAAAKVAEHYGAEVRDQVTFHDIWAFVKRNLIWLLVSAVLGIGAGVAYLLNTPPTYTAVARLVMDPSQAKIASQDAASGTIIIEAAEIASQVEIVKSEAVARNVIAEFDLLNDPEIQNVSSWRGTLMSWVRGQTGSGDVAPPLTGDQRMRRTMAGFLARVSARRVGQSYVLEIGYSSTDPDRAALIANTIALTYIRNGMSERSEAAKRGSAWLEERLIDIAKQARQSQMAVERYRAEKGITPVGEATTLDQRQLAEMSSQLLQAQAATAAEKAKLETIARLVAGTEPSLDMEETLNSAMALKLREEIRAAENRLEGLKLRYTEANPAISSASDEVARLNADLQSEYLRLENAMRSNLEVAKAKERLIQAELGVVRERGVKSNLARVDLTELESRAATYRKMYESVLQQLLSALQVQSFPLGTARITTAASTPLSKSSPRTGLVLPLSLILGLSGGLMIGSLRESMNRSIRSPARLKRETGIGTLSSVPVYRPGGAIRGGWDPAAKTRIRVGKMRAIIDDPYSTFSETIRDLKTSIDAGNPQGAPIVIGVTSAQAGEGKTTIAANLAQLYHNESVPTVIVDADFETASLSLIAASSGEDSALAAEGSPAGYGQAEADTVHVAGGRKNGRGRKSADITSDKLAEVGAGLQSGLLSIVRTTDLKDASGRGPTFRHLAVLRSRLAELRKKYRVIVVDMSGFASSADSRAVCAMVDGVVIVVGDPKRTTLEFFSKSLRHFGPARINILGVVLNRTAPDYPARQGRRRRGL